LLTGQAPSDDGQVSEFFLAAQAGAVVPVDTAAFLGGVVAAVLGCGLRPGWRLARLLVTAVHELGHAVVVVLLGGKVGRVDLWSSAAGLTTFTLPRQFGRARSAAVALAGYPAPGLAGLVGAILVVAGQARAWLWIAAVVTAVLLVLWVRNAWGIWTCTAVAAALGWLAYGGADELVTAVGTALTALLLIGGWRAAVTHVWGREHGGRHRSDAGLAARALRAPPAFWSGVFLLAASATLAAGAWLLAGALDWQGWVVG
jgi:hypothetical protein